MSVDMAQWVAQHVMALDDGAATIRALYAVGHVDDRASWTTGQFGGRR
jgi:hypothetical protein